MKVYLDPMTNLGLYIVKIQVMYFGTTVSSLPSQVPGPPQWESTWIILQVLCPSTASLTPWLSSTESRPPSLSLFMLDSGFTMMVHQLSWWNWSEECVCSFLWLLTNVFHMSSDSSDRGVVSFCVFLSEDVTFLQVELFFVSKLWRVWIQEASDVCLLFFF